MAERDGFPDMLLDLLGASTRVESRVLEQVNTKDGWGISKNFYSILGLIAAESARLEELLGVLCILCLGVEPESGAALVANLGSGPIKFLERREAV